MKYRTRIYYSETDKALMWERWRQGESLQRIAQVFDRSHSVIGGILARTGGIRPAPRCRSALALELSEREEISRGVMAVTLDAYDGTRTRSGPEHSEPRDRPQRRSGGVPGKRGGCVGVAAGQAAEAL